VRRLTGPILIAWSPKNRRCVSLCIDAYFSDNKFHARRNRVPPHSRSFCRNENARIRSIDNVHTMPMPKTRIDRIAAAAPVFSMSAVAAAATPPARRAQQPAQKAQQAPLQTAAPRGTPVAELSLAKSTWKSGDPHNRLCEIRFDRDAGPGGHAQQTAETGKIIQRMQAGAGK
jgi:hypothetical protein